MWPFLHFPSQKKEIFAFLLSVFKCQEHFQSKLNILLLLLLLPSFFSLKGILRRDLLDFESAKKGLNFMMTFKGVFWDDEGGCNDNLYLKCI